MNSYCSITSWRLRCPGRLFVQQFWDRTSAQKWSYAWMSKFYHLGLKVVALLPQPQSDHLTTNASRLHLSECRRTGVAEPFGDVNVTLRLHPAPTAAGQQLWLRFGRYFVAWMLHKKLPTTLPSSKECTEAKSCWDSYDTCLLRLRWDAEKRSLILSVAQLHMAFCSSLFRLPTCKQH